MDMPLVYEPILEGPLPQGKDFPGVRLLGIESTERHPSWPTMRHVFDLGADAGLHVEVGPFDTEVYAIAYSDDGDELLTPL